MPTVELLETRDIYDFYGCEFLYNNGNVEEHDRSEAERRIKEIYGKYLFSVRERIKAEFRFLGLEEGSFSLKKMIETLDNLLEAEMTQQSEQMMALGGGFNMMKVVLEASKERGEDVSEFNGKFGFNTGLEPPKPKNTIDPDCIVNNPKWKTIADAFIQLEDAKTTKEMILSVDRLNGLQHNSFHLLIDLQTGRMLENSSEGGMKGRHQEAVNTVQEVLDIKMSAKTPMEYAGKMSSDVRKILTGYRFLFKR
jgi:hypothetical protein